MENFFLRSKAFILFIPLIMPMLLSFYFQIAYFNWINEWQQQMLLDPGTPPPLNFDALAEYDTILLGYLAVMALTSFIQLGWWYTVSTKLKRYLPTGTNLKPGRFKVAFIIVCAYLVLGFLAQYFLFHGFVDLGREMAANIEAGTDPDFIKEDGFLAKLLFSIGLFVLMGTMGIIAMGYCAYYTGKTLRCIELQKPQQGSAILGYAVLSYFLMIGVWVLQPKIRRLVETGSMEAGALEEWK